MSRAPTSSRDRRGIHPAAWWVWAGSLSAAAIRTSNPVLLLLLGAVACEVTAVCRTAAPWGRSLSFFVRLGVVIIVVRVVLEALVGSRTSAGHVLVTLPSVPLPRWAAGVSLGGPVTAEGLLTAAVQGLRLAVVLVCVGAANSLASPYRLLRCLPAVLYEAGVAVTVALAFVPELVASVAAVREARLLRGRPVRGVAGLRGMVVPVLQRALDRSLHLAASMDARGYGRRSDRTTAHRRLVRSSSALGLLALPVGVYGVLDPTALGGAGLPVLAAAAALLATSLVAGGRRTVRTRYRPDPWQRPEWVVAAAGLVVLTAFVVAGAAGVAGLTYVTSPLGAPAVPVGPAAAVLVGLVPAVTVPRVARRVRAAPAPTLADPSPALPGGVR